MSRDQFVREALAALCDQVRCEVGEIRLIEPGGTVVRWRFKRDGEQFTIDRKERSDGRSLDGAEMPELVFGDDGPLEALFAGVGSWRPGAVSPAVVDRTASRVTERGAVSVDDTARLYSGAAPIDLAQAELMRSMIAMPMELGGGRSGLVILGSRETWTFGPEVTGYLEEVTRILGIALVHREAHRDLRERVKEMTCLYALARAAQRNLVRDDFLRQCVELLPPAFRFPEWAMARIVFDGAEFASADFPGEAERLSAPIRIDGRERGVVEVAYRAEFAGRAGSPFLAEEGDLLVTVANNLALILEQREAEQQVDGLQDQLRHADRLATIGQVTAGVVHELNEPLGSILGFAQLVKKERGLTGQTRQDVDKIIAAALHSREVVKRLMLFARRMPPRRNRVNLNEVIREGLYFLESRCERLGIELVRDLQPDLPELIGDASQLYQVLVNLVVNAIQAMPEGGCITIRTDATEREIVMSIADTGVGMSGAVREKALQPFFTTKSVNEGTGLGLAVVNGIVAAHGGAIKIESEEGKGSRFEIRLPRGSGVEGTGEVKTDE